MTSSLLLLRPRATVASASRENGASTERTVPRLLHGYSIATLVLPSVDGMWIRGPRRGCMHARNKRDHSCWFVLTKEAENTPSPRSTMCRWCAPDHGQLLWGVTVFQLSARMHGV